MLSHTAGTLMEGVVPPTSKLQTALAELLTPRWAQGKRDLLTGIVNLMVVGRRK